MQSTASKTKFTAAQLRQIIDQKTKPVGALGRVESLAHQIGCIQQSYAPRMEQCCAIIFVADHGIARSLVSAYPQKVTRQMLLNLLSGGAAANVFAKSVGADCLVVDAGVIGGQDVEHPNLIRRPLGEGTDNFLDAPAMTQQTCAKAIAHGEALVQEQHCDAFCFGEMGIGNTSSASLLLHKTLGLPLDDLVGRGTGLDDDGLAHKSSTLKAAAHRTDDALGPQEALAEYGGFEIAMMVGAMLGAARSGRIVLVDGFIATAAAALASRIEADVRDTFVYTHRSAERGHQVALQALNAEPLFDLSLRLGEGSGALLAWPIVKAAAAMLRDMASFDSAGVSGQL